MFIVVLFWFVLRELARLSADSFQERTVADSTYYVRPLQSVEKIEHGNTNPKFRKIFCLKKFPPGYKDNLISITYICGLYFLYF